MKGQPLPNRRQRSANRRSARIEREQRLLADAQSTSSGTSSDSPVHTIAVNLARKLLTRGINLEWMLNELYRNPEWLAMVPDGPSKLALRDEIEQILRGITL